MWKDLYIASEEHNATYYLDYVTNNSSQKPSDFDHLQTELENIVHSIHYAFEQNDFTILFSFMLTEISNTGLVNFLNVSSEWNQLLNLLELGLQASLQVSDTVKIAYFKHQIGSILLQQGNYQLSEQYISESLSIKNENLLLGVASSLHQLGSVEMYQGNYQKAYLLILESLKHLRVSGSQTELATSLYQLGSIQIQLGNYAIARDFLQRSFKLHEKHNDLFGKAFSLLRLGTLELELENLEEAEEYFLQSLHVREQLNDKSGIASSLSQIGSLWIQREDYKKAKHYLLQSIEIAQLIGNKLNISTSLHQLGSISIKEKQYDQAISYFQRSLSIKKVLNDALGIVNSLYQLGFLYAELNKYKISQENLVQSLHLCMKYGFEKESVYNLGLLGQIKAKSKNKHEIADGIAKLYKSVIIARKLSLPVEAELRNSLYKYLPEPLVNLAIAQKSDLDEIKDWVYFRTDSER